MSGTVTDAVTRMKDLYEAFGRGDFPTVLAAMDDAIEWHGFQVRSTRFLGDAEVVHIWDLRDGKVVRFHQYVDTRQFADVLGEGDQPTA